MAGNQTEKKDCPTAVEMLKTTLMEFFKVVKASAIALASTLGQKLQEGVSMVKENVENAVDKVNDKLEEAKVAAVNVGESVEENIKTIASSVADPKTVNLLKRIVEQLRTTDMSNTKLADEIKQHIEELNVTKAKVEKLADEAVEATDTLTEVANKGNEKLVEASTENAAANQKYYKYKNKYIQLKNRL
jgi:chromosome segregation ATPase